MRLGTYNTFDAPHIADQKEKEKIIEEAFEYLKKEFDKIGGDVRIVNNPHDFGSYPSFEIDYPYEIEEIKDEEDELYEDSENGDKEADKKIDELDKWHEDADNINDKYCEKFTKYL